MERTGHRLFARIVAFAILAILVGMTVLGARSIALLDTKIGPELRANAEVIGDRVRGQIETALALGIPLDGLVGVNDYLETALNSGPGASRLDIAMDSGETLYSVAVSSSATAGQGTTVQSVVASVLPAGTGQSDVITLPIRANGATVATLSVHVDQQFVARQLQDISLDIIVLAGVAILLAVEILLLIMSRSIRGPLTQFGRIADRLAEQDFRDEARPAGARFNVEMIEAANALARQTNAAARALRDRIDAARASALTGAQSVAEASLVQAERALSAAGRFALSKPGRLPATQLIGVRGAAFLFVLAEELTRPFMPLFAQGVTQGIETSDRAILIAIPISAFMAGAALAGPFAAVFSDRIGRRRSFMVGAVISTAGLAWTAFATGFPDLVISRVLSGLGYALTFVACQGQIIDKTDAASRTVGMSVFVGGIMAADICGPAIGGILADQIGYRQTLLVSAGTAAFAAIMAVMLLDNERRYGPAAQGNSGLVVFGDCLRNPRFLGVILLTAIPAKMVLTGFLFFLVPLIMIDLGSSEAAIGRVAMIYGISAILLMPVFAMITDRFKAHGVMVGLGALLTGWTLVPLAFEPGVALVTLAVAGLGVGQAMSIPAQTVLVTLLSERQIAQYGPGPVLGVFRLAERLGAVLGPLVAAQAMQVVGLAKAAALFGGVTVVTGTVFAAVFLTVGLQSGDDASSSPDAKDAAS